MLNIKRIYEQPATTDGMRILVDRLWPRGLTKEAAAIDLWLKDIAPSSVLRTWFDHRPERFAAFTQKYQEELSQNPATKQLREILAHTANATLLYAAKNPTINHAVVLQKYIES